MSSTPLQQVTRDSEVYERIYQSVMENRLPPGTKMPEEKLAAIFDVTRACIRKILGRLENERIVVTIPNRGAFIAKPTFEDSEDIFEARRALEPAIVMRLARSAAAHQVKALRAHVRSEFEARAVDDKRAMIRLTGEFHNLLADLAGNEAMARPMRELTALTCLAILLYNSATVGTCRADEHDELVDLIEKGDETGAATAVTRHLEELRQSLSFQNDSGVIDLAAALC